mmetsp:Transcript_37711/g.59672  ORF Transcript_37711/g.59672 Transcript_37711/m.59672 type:complete len:218 (-) Transcript_37711:47-700(-)
MFFNGCCCADKTEEVTFAPGNDRMSYGHGYGYEASPAIDPGFSGMGTRLVPERPLSVPALTNHYEGEITPNTASREREKAEEKLRLQELVKTFAKRATQGIDCHLLSPETRELSPARYFLEKDLRELRVKADGGLDITCPISQVSDIQRIKDDDSTLPQNLVGVLDASVRSRLLLIQYRERLLLLVEARQEDAETFFTSLRVLRLYCQQQDYVRAGR